MSDSRLATNAAKKNGAPQRSTPCADKRLSADKVRAAPALEMPGKPSPDDDPLPVGLVFKARREKFGQTLEDVASDLCIRKAYLFAIENGDYDALPGKAYAIGFVRAYADHCGLDVDDMVGRFKAEIGDRPSQPTPSPAAKPNPAPRPISAPATGPRRAGYAPVAPAGGRRISSRTILVALIAVVALGYGGWILMSPQEEKPEPYVADGGVPATAPSVIESAPESVERVSDVDVLQPAATVASAPAPSGPVETAPVAAAPPVAPAVAPPLPSDDATENPLFVLTPRPKSKPFPGSSAAVPSPTIPPAPIVTEIAPTPTAVPPVETADAQPAVPSSGQSYGAVGGDSRVVFRAVQETPIKIHSITGEVLFEGTLKPGDSYHVPDKPGLLMMTGNAGGLDVRVDGQPAPSLGPAGERRQNVFLSPELIASGQAAPQ